MTTWSFDINPQKNKEISEKKQPEKTFNNVKELKEHFVMPLVSRIFVADNLVDYNIQQQVYNNCIKHNYFLGWEDRIDE